MTYDIIIGNGILSLSMALSLALLDPSLKIRVIGRANREGEARVAAGAMLNVYADLTNVSLPSSEGHLKFETARKFSLLWPNWIKEIMV
ncbi:MAG: hypothetical protein K0M45_08885 [Candidatus Paracaedibacteraceae bacterium]|nr:hypothetical protein [Candidatus Paracaedibacteraceae bacterium]